MPTYLVTGAAGFIGRSIAAALLARGESVRGIDSLITGKRSNLVGLEAMEFIEGDLADPAACAKACAGVEIVFHEAALVGWIGGSRWISPVTVALAVISVMLLARVVTWNDILANKQAWSVLVWFATLVAMAEGLGNVGFLAWFGSRAATYMPRIPLVPMLIAAVTVFFVIHYLFASITAQTTALLPVFLLAVLSVPGVPARAITLVLVYSLGLMGVLTPYASGPAPIWFSSGYIPTKDFWRLGATMGAVYLVVLLALGLPLAINFLH